jgi:WD40 repeat protein
LEDSLEQFLVTFSNDSIPNCKVTVTEFFASVYGYNLDCVDSVENNDVCAPPIEMKAHRPVLINDLTLSEEQKFPLRVMSMATLPEGKVAVGTEDGQIRVYSFESFFSLQFETTISTMRQSSAPALIFVPEIQAAEKPLLISAHQDGGIRCWNWRYICVM